MPETWLPVLTTAGSKPIALEETTSNKVGAFYGTG